MLIGEDFSAKIRRSRRKYRKRKSKDLTINKDGKKLIDIIEEKS